MNMALRSVLLLLPCLCGHVDAWGVDGHTIVAHIADHYLSPDVAAVLRNDLYNVSLNNASDWCDDFDHQPDGEWSAPLHFINYPDHACGFDWATDCKNDWCNAGAIVNYSKQIFDQSKTKAERFIALKFVIHMVGDIHQPLHVSSGGNEGGNAIKIPFPHFSKLAANNTGRDTNLHAVWDENILVNDIYETEDEPTTFKAGSRAGKGGGGGGKFVPDYHDWSVLASALEKRMDSTWAANKTAWQAVVTGSRDEATLRKGLTVVAQESAVFSCSHAYDYANGSAVQGGDVLDRAYFLRARPVVEEQLAKGGVRLAMILQEALAKSRMATENIMV